MSFQYIPFVYVCLIVHIMYIIIITPHILLRLFCPISSLTNILSGFSRPLLLPVIPSFSLLLQRRYLNGYHPLSRSLHSLETTTTTTTTIVWKTPSKTIHKLPTTMAMVVVQVVVVVVAETVRYVVRPLVVVGVEVEELIVV